MPKYEIRGLYGPAITVESDSEEDARLGYHVERPGWAGVVFSVTEIKDDDDG